MHLIEMRVRSIMSRFKTARVTTTFNVPGSVQKESVTLEHVLLRKEAKQHRG
jgi:hypothetical protein